MPSSSSARVRFVVVPFVRASLPMLGVSSLLSVLRAHGIDGDIRYLNVSYAARVGWDFYRYVNDVVPTPFLPGEVVFSRALWGERAPAFETYERRVREWIEQLAGSGDAGVEANILAYWPRHVESMRAAIEEAPRVVVEWADEVLEGAPRVLGFSSTFQQSIAALALAQEVRRRVSRNEVAILFGGANCEDEMGRALADNFPFLDCVVSGEAEDVIVDVVRRACAGPANTLPRFVKGPMVRDMDALPLPAFDDYFTAVSGTAISRSTWLTAESSRGCWWGAKSHCTFCGFNCGRMAFRSKSATRFADELQALSREYGATRFCLTDSILDMSYLRTLLPELVREARTYELLYETKSNLRKDQVELLAAAGVSTIQPGIESLSTPILKLMGKGTTRLQNIQLLKWCAELGVSASWNLLYGFPGEDPREYQEMAELLPALFHLPPPNGALPLRLDRFAPYWMWPERYGIRNARHHWSYDIAFAGLPDEQRARLATFFEHEYADGGQALLHARLTAERAFLWREAARSRVTLELRTSEQGTSVLDTRPCRRDETFPLSPAGVAMVRALDGIRSRGRLSEALREQGVGISEAECDALLAELKGRRFAVEEGGSWLSLIVDPRERRRVAERQVALRVGRLGLRWPQDFPDPEKRQVVRAAMLALGNEASSAAATS